MRSTYPNSGSSPRKGMLHMSKHLTVIAVLFASLAIAACGVEPLDSSSDSGDLEELLAAPRTFGIDETTSAINALAVALRQGTESNIEFEIVSGEVALQASDGDLSISGVQVVLADVTIPETVLPPNGLVITDMLVTLDGSATAAAEWTGDGRRADASFAVDFTVKWSMLRDGSSYPLADVLFQDLPLHLGVTRDGDGIDIDVSADRDGAFWSWAETFELRDLEMSLAGVY